MTTQKSLLTFVVAGGLAFTSITVTAGVKSMSSDEMTETFIKDTTIIVTPAQKSDSDSKRKKDLTSLTISPGEAEKSEAEVQAEFEENKDQQDRQLNAAIANYDEQVKREMVLRQINSSQLPPPDVSGIYAERPMPNIPGFVVPEGDFAYNFVGNQLGLSRDDNQLTMSFGNLPGIGDIKIPNAVNEGPIQLTPRQGGGFDLIIDIPQN
ncbi:MAG: hypothetical protein H7A01_17925 [Hahellaceae bacterium]|nr:hypothetical protein [Hahellaceae bacterium]MCP5212187.1 hypothetical protein [Hahellaceae bacterium]